MSHLKEIQAIFQVSQVLLKAFEQIHQITGDFINQKKQKKQEKPEESSKAPHNQEKTKQEKKKQKSQQKKQPEPENPKKEESKPKPVEEGNSKKEKLKEKKEKKKHHPDRPKFPISGYFRFNQENLEKIKNEYPDMPQKELVTLSSLLWNKLSDEEKKPYEASFEKDKKAYNIAIQKFYNAHPEERPKSRKA